MMMMMMMMMIMIMIMIMIMMNLKEEEEEEELCGTSLIERNARFLLVLCHLGLLRYMFANPFGI